MGCGSSSTARSGPTPGSRFVTRHGSVGGVSLDTFVENQWKPFADELRKELRYVEAKAAAGFSESERLPPQDKFIGAYGRHPPSVALLSFFLKCSGT